MIKKVILLAVSTFFVSISSYANPVFKGVPGQKPLSVAVDFLQGKLPVGDEEGKQKTTITQERIYCKPSQTCSLQTKVVMIIDDVPDDSIKAQKYTVILQENKNTWEVVDTMLDQSCHKGRGHIDFSDQPCK